MKEKKEVPGVRGGGIIKTQHVSGGIPLLREREKRQELGARKTRRRKKKKSGETFDISFATTRF